MPVTSDLVFQAYTVRLMKVTSVFPKNPGLKLKGSEMMILRSRIINDIEVGE